jgi:amino acid transporter
VFGAFIGFESTAIYSEEARDPERTVPRAVYLAVAFLGIFYTFMAWVVYVAFGNADIVEAATADPVGLVFTATEQYVGHWAVVVMELLLVTSAFASTLAFHNTASRYLFTLGRERMLPQVLARVHPRHHSPHVASAVQGVVALVVITCFVIADADAYLQVFLLMVAPGVLTVIVLQAVCSLAIIVYFNRVSTTHGLSAGSTRVAPALSLVGLAVASWLVARNFELLSGRTDWVNWLLLGFIPLAFLAGVARALWLGQRQPEVYATLTRTEVF